MVGRENGGGKFEGGTKRRRGDPPVPPVKGRKLSLNKKKGKSVKGGRRERTDGFRIRPGGRRRDSNFS